MSDNISITSNKSQKTITQNENIEKLKENLGKEETSKEWYKEIVKLKKVLEKKIKEIPEPEKKDFQRIKDKLEYHFGCGNEELVIYLLKNYPVQGNEYSENKMQEYNKNKNI